MNEQAIALVTPTDMQVITSMPDAYRANSLSHDRCLAAGQELVTYIQQHGMDDDTDLRCQQFIDKARRTVAKLNDTRSPITKIFDMVRSNFTQLEGEIDPTKRGSIPYTIQAFRNEYATKKRQEEEARRRQAMQQQQRQQDISRYRADVEADYRRVFNVMLNGVINHITQLNTAVTLDNYDRTVREITAITTQLPEQLLTTSRLQVMMPVTVTADELDTIRRQVLDTLMPDFRQNFQSHVAQSRDTVLAMLPSKQAELQRAAQASAEEAERIRQQIAERDAQEQQRRQQQLIEQQQREQQQAALAQQQAEVAAAFGTAEASLPSYQPKTQVKQRIQVTAPEGFLKIINLWWTTEGCTLTVEELAKMFKKQITFAEKMANAKEPIILHDPAIIYTEEVKAK